MVSELLLAATALHILRVVRNKFTLCIKTHHSKNILHLILIPFIVDCIQFHYFSSLRFGVQDDVKIEKLGVKPIHPEKLIEQLKSHGPPDELMLVIKDALSVTKISWVSKKQ